MIHGTLKQFLEAFQTRRKKGTSNGRQNNRWRQFDPRVTVHYAHNVLPPLVTRERPSWIQSPSPPCNNLRMPCIKSSVLRSDSNKMDVARGREYVKMHANKLFTGTSGTRGNFYGQKMLSFTADDQDVYEMWWTDAGAGFTAPALSAHPRGCIKEGWERRKQGEVSAKRNKVERK